MQSEKVHLTKKQEGSGNMHTIVKASIFRLIQIAWSPIALVGYVLFVIKLIIFSRKSGSPLRENRRWHKSRLHERPFSMLL